MKKENNLNSPSAKGGVVRQNLTFADIQYQFVFCARYRRKIFKEFAGVQIECQFKELLAKIAEEMGIEIQSCLCQEDRVYLDVKAPPIWSPADIMAKIKSKTSRELRQQIQGLSHLQGLWTRAYFVTTQPVLNHEEVDWFLAQQKTRS